MKKPQTSIPVIDIIENASEALTQSAFWMNSTDLSTAQRWITLSVVLTELAEVAYCGCSGGKQVGFPPGRKGLRKRIDHLKKVYNIEK